MLCLNNLKNSIVVGEDGELIQPDTTVDPNAYTEYVATYVHRDPFVFRLREHVKDWGCAYLFVTPLAILFIGLIVAVVFEQDLDAGTRLELFLIVVLLVGAYWKLRSDNRN